MVRLFVTVLGVLGITAFALLSMADDAVKPAPPAPAAELQVAQNIPLPVPAVEAAVGDHHASAARKFVGSTSCAAANCHGGDGVDRRFNSGFHVVGSEYSEWVQNDIHAQAYNVLFNDVSKSMAKALNEGDPKRYSGPAHEMKECLACHSPNSAGPVNFDKSHHILTDGVGCESCHGAASDWLAPHIQPSWKGLSAAEKAKLGYRDTDDLLIRAQVCAECHIGGSHRDANHDFYAAGKGHPRLFFEMTAFHANMPKHWVPQVDHCKNSTDAELRAIKNPSQVPGDMSKVQSGFEAKLWSVGQVASAEAAVNLLKFRQENKLLPELAHYSCFHCHHNIDGKEDRFEIDYAKGRLVGAPPFGTRVTPILKNTSAWHGVSFAGDSAFNNIFKRLEKYQTPNSSDISTLQAQLSKAGAKLNNENLTTETLHGLMKDIASWDSQFTTADWDAAAQMYLALVALHRGSIELERGVGVPPSRSERRISDALSKLRGEIRFPDGYNSPEGYNILTDDGRLVIKSGLKTIKELTP